MMRKLRLWLSYLLMIAGSGLMYLAYKRNQLPYNEEGRYFDTTNIIVYHQQSIETFVLSGVALIITGFIIWSVTAKI